MTRRFSRFSLIDPPWRRYQHQSWLVRRWRDRWLLLVPYYALRTWLAQGKSERPLPWKHCWSIERGMVDVRRGYVYDWADLPEAWGKHKQKRGMGK